VNGWFAIPVLCIALYAYSEGIQIAWVAVRIQPTTPQEPLEESYFGIEEEPVPRVRNIAFTSGTFSKGTWLTAELFVVSDHSIQSVNAFTVGRSPNSLGEPQWISMPMQLALGDREAETGRSTSLGIAGHTRGGGRGADVIHHVSSLEQETFPGTLWSGRTYLLHVEGDRPFEANRSMTVEQFSEANDGQFLVVTVKLN
jgi:hypothetical protein